MLAITNPFQQLELRRKRLGMSMSALAARSGVSLPTVRRILRSGPNSAASFANVLAIANELGMSTNFAAAMSEQEFLERHAREKARRLVGMVQATSALEGQGLDAQTVADMEQRTVHELLAGSRRKLWAS